MLVPHNVFSSTKTKFHLFNSLPNDKFLDWIKLRAFAHEKSDVAEKLLFVLGRVENIVSKGEKPAVSPFPTMFSKGFFVGSLSHDCVVKS